MGSAIRNYQRRLSVGVEKVPSSKPPPTEGRRTSVYLDHMENGRPVYLPMPERRRVSLHPDYTSDKEYCKLVTRRASFDAVELSQADT